MQVPSMRRPLIPAPWSYILVILAFACLGAYGLGNWLLSRACIFCGSALDTAAIEANTDVDIPDSATDIQSYAEGLRDITTYVRFIIPARELDAFLASTGCEDPPTSIDEPSPNLVVPTWWRPDEATSLIGCTGTEGRTHQTLYIDMSLPDTVSIFLVAAVY